MGRGRRRGTGSVAAVDADAPGASRMADAAGDLATSAACGDLTTEPGVRLRWPDGETTAAVDGPATGLGRA